MVDSARYVMEKNKAKEKPYMVLQYDGVGCLILSIPIISCPLKLPVKHKARAFPIPYTFHDSSTDPLSALFLFSSQVRLKTIDDDSVHPDWGYTSQTHMQQTP